MAFGNVLDRALVIEQGAIRGTNSMGVLGNPDPATVVADDLGLEIADPAITLDQAFEVIAPPLIDI